MVGPEKLGEIAETLKAGQTPEPVTVRQLLSWFYAQRRGSSIVYWIRSSLKKHSLETDPDFEGAYIDERIRFVLARPAPTPRPEDKVSPRTQVADPTYRIGKLPAANTPPTSAAPDDPIQRATTLMLSNDFSQLPIMTSNREVKGIVSWTTLGSRLALGQECNYVRQCMDSHTEISSDASLFDAIDTIIASEYVLIRARDGIISGIVTTSDLSLQFQQLGEPFLLIGEVENYIRRLIQDRFTPEDLQNARDPADDGRNVESVSDLNFGEYKRLLEGNDNWAKLGIAIDRVEFIKSLDQIRRIRNDVMHFDPDGIPDSDLERLRDFVRFLQRMANMGVI